MSPKRSCPTTLQHAAFPPNLDNKTATFPTPPGDIDMYLELTVPPVNMGLRVPCRMIVTSKMASPKKRQSIFCFNMLVVIQFQLPFYKNGVQSYYYC